jgi:hypothetical protein
MAESLNADLKLWKDRTSTQVNLVETVIKDKSLTSWIGFELIKDEWPS